MGGAVDDVESIMIHEPLSLARGELGSWLLIRVVGMPREVVVPRDQRPRAAER